MSHTSLPPQGTTLATPGSHHCASNWGPTLRSHTEVIYKKYSWKFRKIQMWIQNSNPKFKIEIQILFFNKVTGLRPATLLKRNLWHRYFPVNFAKFLKAYFFKTPLDNCFFMKHIAIAGCSNSHWITNLSYKWQILKTSLNIHGVSLISHDLTSSIIHQKR